MFKIVACLFALFIFLFFYPPVFADTSVVINEFYALGSGDDPDWVELYNQGEGNVNLEGWLIRDETESNKISLGGYICAKSFRKFEFSNRLNNSGDKIRLFDSESATIPTDEVNYFSDSIPTHSQGQSTSRNPDGTSTWVLMTSPTPTDNNSCTPSPTASPSPTPTPQTSQSPTPTPAKTPSLKPSPTSQTLKSPAASPKLSPNVLSEKIAGSPSPTPAPETPKESSKVKIASVLTGSGLILIGLSVGFYLWYNKVLFKKEKDQDNKQES